MKVILNIRKTFRKCPEKLTEVYTDLCEKLYNRRYNMITEFHLVLTTVPTLIACARINYVMYAEMS